MIATPQKYVAIKYAKHRTKAIHAQITMNAPLNTRASRACAVRVDDASQMAIVQTPSNAILPTIYVRF